MVDFTLVVGIDPKLSYTEIKNGIEEVVHKIEEEPIYVKKLRIDPMTLSNITTAVTWAIKDGISRATESLSINGRAFANGIRVSFEELEPIIQSLAGVSEQISSVFKDGGPFTALAEAYGKHTESVQSAVAAEKEKESQSNKTAGALLREAVTLKEGADAAEREAEALGNVSAAAKGIDGGTFEKIGNALRFNGFNASQIKSIQDELSSLEGSVRDVIVSTDKLGEAGDQVATLTINRVDAMGNSFQTYLRYIKNAEGEWERLNNRDTKKILFQKDDSVQQETDRIRELTRAYAQYESKWTQIYRQQVSMEGVTGFADQSSYQKIVGFIDQLNALYTSFANGKITFEQFKSEMSVLDGQFSNNTRSVLSFINAHKQEEQQTAESIAALRQYESMINGIDGRMRSMTLIGGDKAKDTDEYIKLEELRERLVALKQEFGDQKDVNAFRQAMQLLGIEIEENKGKVSAYIAQQKLQRENAKNYAATLEKLETALKKNSAAKNSNNKETASAYRTIEEVTSKLKTNAQEVANGTMSQEEFRQSIAEANNTLREQMGVIKGNGSAFQSWADQFKNIGRTLSYWVSPMRILMRVIQYIKKMVSASIELNDAMTQMQIVTRATDAEMAKFGESASAASQRIGSSITDFVSSATTYARLGYNTEESSAFAEYTAMLQNVGDIEVSDAQDAITAIVKAYNKGADEIESVMDKIVTIGNNYPISVAQIAEGMNNASSTLAAANNSFEESLALLTAANTTVELCRAA